jgi:hypothetical protein
MKRMRAKRRVVFTGALSTIDHRREAAPRLQQHASSV